MRITRRGQGGTRGRIRRGPVFVAACAALFAVPATVLTVAGAAQRRQVWAARTPLMVAAQRASDAAAAARTSGMRFLPAEPTVQQWLTQVPTPAGAATAIAGHVLAQTLLVLALAALVHTLARAGRPLAATAVVAAAVLQVLASAGPLAWLPGTLAYPATVTVNATATPTVTYSAPWWWRALAVLVLLLPLAAAALTGHRLRRPDRTRRDAVAATAVFVLTVELVVTVLPNCLLPDGTATGPALVAAATLLVLGWVGALAAATGDRTRGPWPALSLALVNGLAWATAWAIYHGDQAGPVVFGWGMDGGQAPQWGTLPLAGLAVAAPVLGWTTTATTSLVLAARRHDGRRGEPRGRVPVPRHAAATLVALATLVVGVVASTALTRHETRAADHVAAVVDLYHYADAVTLASTVTPPTAAAPTTDPECHVEGRVACWSVPRPFVAVEKDLTARLTAATGRTPITTWRLNDFAFPGDNAMRTGVTVDGYRIEAQITTTTTGQGRTLAPTGRQTVLIAVSPDDDTT